MGPLERRGTVGRVGVGGCSCAVPAQAGSADSRLNPRQSSSASRVSRTRMDRTGIRNDFRLRRRQRGSCALRAIDVARPAASRSRANDAVRDLGRSVGSHHCAFRQQCPAVDDDRLARHVGSRVGSQEEHRVRNVFGTSETAEGNLRHQLRLMSLVPEIG